MGAVPEFPPEVEAKSFPGGFTLRDEANAIVAKAFRNGPLEDLHAGEHSELLDDDRYSRITDAEMKRLMVNACEQVEALLRLKQESPKQYEFEVKAYAAMYCRGWRR
ncbi:MAG: hypothetical protein MI757_16230 [Pirellulales bacterium]|nr:hypothetical protein [Pirellulales bacterium]